MYCSQCGTTEDHLHWHRTFLATLNTGHPLSKKKPESIVRVQRRSSSVVSSMMDVLDFSSFALNFAPRVLPEI